MSDATNPDHYKQGDIECIVAMESALTPEEFIGAMKFNVMKYNWRAKHKDGATAYDKALWYQTRLVDYLKRKDSHDDVMRRMALECMKSGYQKIGLSWELDGEPTTKASIARYLKGKRIWDYRDFEMAADINYSGGPPKVSHPTCDRSGSKDSPENAGPSTGESAAVQMHTVADQVFEDGFTRSAAGLTNLLNALPPVYPRDVDWKKFNKKIKELGCPSSKKQSKKKTSKRTSTKKSKKSKSEAAFTESSVTAINPTSPTTSLSTRARSTSSSSRSRVTSLGRGRRA